MSFIGQIFLWCGFLGAALSAVYQVEVEGHPWQTIPWNWYAVAMFIGVLGVIILRISSRAAAQHAGRVEGEFEVLERSLGILQTHIGELRRTLNESSLRDVVAFIDNNCAEPFADFVDSRNALVQRYGLQGFADVMTQFASAERFVNRAWSAAADGYLEETKASLEIADNYMHQARQLMDQYQSDS